MTTPRLAFCITCKNRTQHLKLTLRKNLSDTTYPNAVFVLIDYGSEDDLVEFVRSAHSHDLSTGRLVIYSLRNTGPFRMAHAKNVAHRCAILEGAHILVNLDADNYIGPGFAEFVVTQFVSQDRVFLWAPMEPGKMDRGISGRIAVLADDFLKVGGYDERFTTWAPDDKDFNIRLRRLGLDAQPIPRRYLTAVRHTDKMRFREYPEAVDNNYEQCDPKDNDVSCVNFSGYGCCVAFRNFEWHRDIHLRALPTRIFGIGMHKTGTTSLHRALELLGLDSAHWETAHWAKAIWLEMKTLGSSRTLENHYALCDLPIPLLYRELDEAYPGSKFILTIRSEESWLQSVEHHFSYTHNKFRTLWDHDPFTHKIHTHLYGRRRFEREVFIERYRQHNAEVREYFRDRPNDLLEFDLHSEKTWDHLCHFLGKEHPAVPYPAANGTRPIL